MKRIGNKGFTLVELLAIIVLLSLVMGIAGYSVIHIVEKSKDKDYELLIENINNAVELYYQECKFAITDNISCPVLDGTGYYTKIDEDRNGVGDRNITLGDLVEFGFLKGNDTKSDDSYTVVNPYDNVNISSCKIKYKYESGNIVVVAVTTSGSCPTSY